MLCCFFAKRGTVDHGTLAFDTSSQLKAPPAAVSTAASLPKDVQPSEFKDEQSILRAEASVPEAAEELSHARPMHHRDQEEHAPARRMLPPPSPFAQPCNAAAVEPGPIQRISVAAQSRTSHDTRAGGTPSVGLSPMTSQASVSIVEAHISMPNPNGALANSVGAGSVFSERALGPALSSAAGSVRPEELLMLQPLDVGLMARPASLQLHHLNREIGNLQKIGQGAGTHGISMHRNTMRMHRNTTCACTPGHTCMQAPCTC